MKYQIYCIDMIYLLKLIKNSRCLSESPLHPFWLNSASIVQKNASETKAVRNK